MNGKEGRGRSGGRRDGGAGGRSEIILVCLEVVQDDVLFLVEP